MKNKEISTVMMRGRAYNSSSFLLRVGSTELGKADLSGVSVKKNQKKPKNIAFLAPKKVFTTAVTRNKAKRRLKNAFQKLKTSMKANGTFENSFFMAKNKANLVFTAKKQVIEMDFESLYKEMEEVLAKI